MDVPGTISEKNTMVYLVAILGFVCGFFAGQLILMNALREYSKEEILEMMKDPVSRLKYGMLNWLLAVLGTISFVMIYNHYF
ncbi:MAG: hypothetical protein H6868_01045 [Rhodospirillales bacterium]|nr:hypothetical protein [Rhodospirillales bacterium]